MHKSESSTMLCDDHPSAMSPPLPSAASGVEAATAKQGVVVPTMGENITNNPEVTTMLCDEVSTDPKAMDDTAMNVRDLLLLCQLFYLPADHGRVSVGTIRLAELSS